MSPYLWEELDFLIVFLWFLLKIRTFKGFQVRPHTEFTHQIIKGEGIRRHLGAVTRILFFANPKWATRLLTCLVVLIAITGAAHATTTPSSSTYTFTGSTNGGAQTDSLTVSGKATFVVTNAGTITLTLANTTPETMSTNELLTGLDFTLTYQGTTISSSALTWTATAYARTIYQGGTYTTATTTSNIKPDWELTNTKSTSGVYTNQLDFMPGDKYAIVGAPNGSRYGNLKTTGPTSIFNSSMDPQPYDATSATYVFTDKYITNLSQFSISNVSFIYNSSCSFKVPGTTPPGSSVSPVPERGAAMIFVAGIALACLLKHFSPAFRRDLGAV